MALDTFNRYMVGVRGDGIVVLNPPHAGMSKTEALEFAAWLVVLAVDEVETAESEFAPYLAACRGD